MALFKPFMGNRASLDAQPLHDGYAYFCIDDGTFHIDYTDADGNLQRKQLNAYQAEKLSGTLNNFVAIDGTGIDQPYYSTDVGIIAASGIGEKKIKPNTYFFDEASAKAFCDYFGFSETKTINLTFENPQFGQHTGIEYYLAAPATYALVFLPNRDVVGTYNTETLAFTMDGGFISPYIVINEAQLPSMPGGFSEQGSELAELLKNTLFPDLEMEAKEEGFAFPAFVGDDIASKKLKIGKGQIIRDADGSIESFTFLEGQDKTIAVVDNDVANGSLVAWDANKGKLVATELDLDLNIKNGEGICSLVQNYTTDLDPDLETYSNKATAPLAIALGEGCRATGPAAVSMGIQSISSGTASFSLGQKIESAASGALGTGYSNKIGSNAHYSFVANSYNETQHTNTIVGGIHNKSIVDNEVVLGNWSYEGLHLVSDNEELIAYTNGKGISKLRIGAGSENDRKNLLEVTDKYLAYDGSAKINGRLYAKGFYGNTLKINANKCVIDSSEGRITVGDTITAERLVANTMLDVTGGQCYVADPINKGHAVNKKYLDDKLINLEKLVAGLTDAQITALNNFAKSLTVEEA